MPIKEAIKTIAKTLAKVICRHLSPASRSIVARDSIPMQDLVDNLPRNLLQDLLFATARKLKIFSIRVGGQYGDFEGSPHDQVILYHYLQTGTWSPEFQVEVVDHVFRADKGTFVDVGANIGLTSIPAVARHKVDCYAFEPDPANFEFLKRNTEVNKVSDRIKLFNVAAYDSETYLDFELSANNMGDHRIRSNKNGALIPPQQNEESRKVIKIVALPLDQVFSDEQLAHPILLKVDVQGAEPMVFRGAKELLRKTDCLVVEFSPYTLARAGFNEDHFFHELHDFGYGHILSFDKNIHSLASKPSPALPLKEIIDHCRTAALNKHPDNYFDLVLVKRPNFFYE